MHLKRASGRGKKNMIWKESKTSNERECQQRFRAVSSCLSPSQDRLKNLDRREGGVERETWPDCHQCQTSLTSRAVRHWHVYLITYQKPETLKIVLLFAEGLKIKLHMGLSKQSWWMGGKGVIIWATMPFGGIFIWLVDFIDVLPVKSCICWLFDAIYLMQDGQTSNVIVYQWS